MSFDLLATRPGPTPAIQIATVEFGMQREQTADSDALRVDYRTRSAGGARIEVHQTPTFGTGDTGTRVTEVISGQAPPGPHWIALRSARTAHVEHLSRYSDLFDLRAGGPGGPKR